MLQSKPVTLESVKRWFQLCIYYLWILKTYTCVCQVCIRRKSLLKWVKSYSHFTKFFFPGNAMTDIFTSRKLPIIFVKKRSMHRLLADLKFENVICQKKTDVSVFFWCQKNHRHLFWVCARKFNISLIWQIFFWTSNFYIFDFNKLSFTHEYMRMYFSNLERITILSLI